MTNFTIDVTSDFTCVFCFLGKRRLDRAISIWRKTASKTDTFTIRYHPYYLHPELTVEGVDKMSTAIKRLGGEERTREVQQKVRKMALLDGIDFKFGGRCGNTRDAHRLLKYAELKGSDYVPPLLEGLFSAFHEQEKNLAQRDVLIEAAQDAGLDLGDVNRMLDGDQYGAQVDAEAQASRDGGVRGVPHYLLQNSVVIDGAQDASDFLQTFQEIRETLHDE